MVFEGGGADFSSRTANTSSRYSSRMSSACAQTTRRNWCSSQPSTLSSASSQAYFLHMLADTGCSSDTKMTSKSLVAPVISAASTLTTTPQGRRALFHLLVPRTRRHFTPAQIVNLSETDGVRARTSKKDSNIREDEVRKAASDALLEFVVEEGVSVSRETGGSLVVAEIMLYADGGQSFPAACLISDSCSVLSCIHQTRRLR